MKFWGSILLLAWTSILPAQSIHPDSIGDAIHLLDNQRGALLTAETPLDGGHYLRMMELGLWDELDPLLQKDSSTVEEVLYAKAKFAWLNNDFFDAQELLDLRDSIYEPSIPSIILRSQLHIEAWDLDKAQGVCLQYIMKDPRQEDIVLQLARVHLLKKNYLKVKALAEQVQQWNPSNSEAYLLEAEAHFWLQEPDQAISPLMKCLELDPLNADARFAYGYAIWRRVDASQLTNMAAQWDLALAIHPLHFLTHWHWGNGHTHLSYADYLDPDEDSIRTLLGPADSMFSNGNRIDAIRLVKEIARSHSASVIPQLYLGSYYFMGTRADSDALQAESLEIAEQVFRDILRQKTHFGPAHNGLAAVIKKKRFPFLAAYHELEQHIQEAKIRDSIGFAMVFPDVSYYPDVRVPRMIWQQIYTGSVYIPFLQRLGKQFVIPPLHQDLALAMKNSYFRGATTFDNRQWMDIRGVGTGATGIEYVERGAHLERNVTLHEFTHLFHLFLFTDQEMREVRTRYFHAMKEGLTLDYYSANNEFEYLAQTFPAYFIPLKAHPLNHKSLNTRSDLEETDPLMFQFIESLVNKHQAYIDGDSSVMADTWAQTYIRLAEDAWQEHALDQALTFLDTAYQWDSTYLPIYLAYATTYSRQQDFPEAERWLARAKDLQDDYAPIYVSYAEMVHARFLSGEVSEAEAIREQAAYFRMAQELEDDLYIQASINHSFRDFYYSFCRVPEAIEIASAYALNAPTISTDLRDHKLRANAFAKYLQGMMGYGEEVLPYFDKIVKQRPQDYSLLVQYAEVLLSLNKTSEAISLLSSAHSILQAAENPDTEIINKLARSYLLAYDTSKAKEILAPILSQELAIGEDTSSWVVILSDIQAISEAEFLASHQSKPVLPLALSQYYYGQACLADHQAKTSEAIEAYRQALTYNPYHWHARFRLIDCHIRLGELGRARYLSKEGSVLPLPPGPSWTRRLSTALSRSE